MAEAVDGPGDMVAPLEQLDLASLARVIPGITVAFGAMLAESCAVCLADQGHASGVSLTIGGDFEGARAVLRQEVTEAMTRCYDDEPDATRDGAYALALLLMRDLTGLVGIQRGFQRSGFDWWLGEPDEIPFQSKGRLEVSGIRNGPEYVVRRATDKLVQGARLEGEGMPVYAVVIEFSTPLAAILVSE